MRGQVIIRYIGLALLCNAVMMMAATIVSLLYGVDTGFFPLLLSCILSTIVGLFPLIFIPSEFDLRTRESFVIVMGAWLISSIFGMLPYILWGGEFNLTSAWFESVSGYTTTGATILQDIEGLPHSILFWRSSTHLIGGAGIVFFALVMIPSMGRAKVSLSNVEISSFAKDNYNYRLQKTVNIILVVYAILISSETIALRLAGMDWFDAINHSFSTISTGGFSTKNLSIAYYDNIWIETIITIYMILAGLHFGLIFSSITNKKNNLFRSEVSVFYIMCIVLSIILITTNLWTTNTYSFVDSLRYGAFQLCAIISTTGFATVDSGMWPDFSILLLILFSIQCACAGSTTGGIKSDRMLLMFKAFRVRLRRQLHPNAIITTKLNNVIISNEMIQGSLTFICIYLLTLIVGAMVLALMGIDMVTSVTASVACLGNVGPGFGQVSSLSNYAMLPDAAKWFCTLLMVAGRLEILCLVQLFFLRSWK